MNPKLLQIIPANRIDKQAWDTCVKGSNNPLIYGLSWYLDSICNNWEGIVYNNYEAVFPVPFRKKFGIIKYAYQPYFCQQLGLFTSSANISLDLFIHLLKKKYFYYHLYINDLYPIDNYYKKRNNYILPLNSMYETLRKQFKKNAISRLQKLEAMNAIIIEIPIKDAYNIYKNNWREKLRKIDSDSEVKFINACNVAEQHKFVLSIGVKINDSIVAAAIVFKTPCYLHYVVSGATDEGRKHSAVHALVNYLIQQYSNSILMLDFEGSDIESVASFYNKWNPMLSHYYEIKNYNWKRLFS